MACGEPLPALGFVGDLGQSALHPELATRSQRDARAVPGVPPGLLRCYEDHVVGKLLTDWTWERAGDALRRYQGRDRARGLAFTLSQVRRRLDYQCVHLSPAVVKSLLHGDPAAALSQGWESLNRRGIEPILLAQLESLAARCRFAAELLGPEDLFELEHGTALADMGQRVGLRQVLQAAEHLAATLPRHRPRPWPRRQDVPTHVLDEDVYPVGGFSSLANKGTLESLLHSQLAFIEPGDDRPDLFDIKFVRNELLYYARDDNRFLRRRRTFVFALFDDLVATRIKDPDLPWQRGVLLLALLVIVVRLLNDWLAADALTFVIALVGDPTSSLSEERELLEVLFRDAIARRTLDLIEGTEGVVATVCAERARRSQCDCLTIATTQRVLRGRSERLGEKALWFDGPRVVLEGFEEAAAELVKSGEPPLAAWELALEALLRSWL
jgi:hypothetical protein